MVDGHLLRDLILTEGAEVSGFGLVELTGARTADLWVAATSQPEFVRRLAGARERLVLAPAEVGAPPSDRNVLAVGTWDGDQIVDAHLTRVGEPPPETVVRTFADRQAWNALGEKERGAIVEEVGDGAGSQLVSLGGSYKLSHIQLRHITSSFAAWFESLDDVLYPDMIHSSIVPNHIRLSDVGKPSLLPLG